ncbi:MAG: UMP kinase [Chlamydiota bacterium]
MSSSFYKSILLKISGEAFHDFMDFEKLTALILDIRKMGVLIGVVVGGGNIVRGIQAASRGMNRVNADMMGMMSTAINGLALLDSLERKGCPAVVLSAFECPRFMELYTSHKAKQALEEGKVVIFVGGTGNPFFSTDTAAALRAAEMGAEVLLKGTTKVDGIYDKDPRQFSNVVKYEKVTYAEVLEKGLQVMDLTAITLCQEHRIPIYVFDLFAEGALKKAVMKQSVGTFVGGER